MDYLTPKRRIALDKLIREGVTGTPGPQGPVGPQGPKGDAGEQGLKGDKGEPGYTPIKGIDYFDGAKGDKGDQGIQGLKGDKGDKGDPGSDATVTQTNIINALGFTPVNPSSLKPVATSGSYNDLTNKPTIPAQWVYNVSPSLPTPSSSYRGKIYTLLGGAGVADKPYICTKNADETYTWKPITGFSW